MPFFRPPLDAIETEMKPTETRPSSFALPSLALR
jgi:hypothetical protein